MPTDPLPAELAEWLARFRRRHGRPPRVLHLGNVANNAYFNAKMLQAAGVAGDVLSDDTYHIMGCPEWEEADCQGDLRNQFFPAWDAVELNGYHRPRWFAQGPLASCCHYLIARSDGRELTAWWRWKSLAWERRDICREQRHERSGRRLLPLLTCLPRKFSALWQRGRAHIARRLASGPMSQGWKGLLWPFYLMLAGGLLILLGSGAVLKRLTALLSGRPAEEEFNFDRRKVELIERFDQAFPERPDRLTDRDLEDYRELALLCRRVFLRYDLVLAYGASTFWPMLADVPFLALEHGTLRRIPFDSNPTGRRTALSYHLAEHVFVTNLDCLDNARRLAAGTVSLVNHPYPEDHVCHIPADPGCRQRLYQQLDADFLVFFPTRHDWIDGAGDAEKCNDVFLRAFARLRRAGLRIGLVCCRWGANVAASERLLEQEGVARFVRWEDPLGAIGFARMVKTCDLVADQFKLGAFGGIFFKSLAIGAAVCTRLDESLCQQRYGETPPALNCHGEDEIFQKLRDACANPDQLKALAQAGRAWIKTHHRGADTVNQQLEVFRAIIENRHGEKCDQRVVNLAAGSRAAQPLVVQQLEPIP